MEKIVVAQLEASLLTNLAKEKYNSSAKSINKIHKGKKNKLRSHHVFSKDLPVVHTLPCAYSRSNPEEVEEINSDGEKIIEENNENSEQAAPTIINCNGVYTSIEDCINLMLEK